MLETFSNIQNSYWKFCRRFSFYESWSIESSFRSIECSFRSIKQKSSIDWNRHRLRIDFLIFSIDWAKVLIDRKYWISNFHFINFMKQNSPNSNIIITTYLCIYLYIQHKHMTKPQKMELRHSNHIIVENHA